MSEGMPKRKIIFRWIKIILILYGVIGIAIYYLQDYIFFHPEKMEKDRSYNFGIPNKEINIPYNDSININIVQFTTPVPAKGAVLYFHGNRKNIGWYAKYALNFTKNNYEVWMIDYPGFGKSTGKLTEQRLFDYAEQMYLMAASRFPKDSIILYGKSMGSGIAAYIASRKNCKALILETPYYSMESLVAHYLPIYPVGNMIHYKIPSYQYLRQVIVPVIIFHGTSDGVIPYSNAKKLQPFLKPADEFVTIDGGSHNDLNDFPLFHQKLDSVLKRP
jgi:alpha-beta hydrolase superfamily lysophospholipase